MTQVVAWRSFEELDAAQASSVRDYLALLKPRVMSLVVFCGMIGVMMAPGYLHPFQAMMAVFCIAMATGASAAFNMWYERDIDALMERTKNRPVAAGRIAPEEALSFAVILGGASVLLMGISTNWHAAFWLVVAIASYAWLYTVLLKRHTHQNIVIGGIAGALPPLIGWVAVTGGLHWLPCWMVALIFLWTPPHFWALAIYRHQDYQKAAVPMLPVVKGELATKRSISFYAVALVAVSFLGLFDASVGTSYGVSATLLGGWFLWAVFRLQCGGNQRDAMRVFGVSIVYLFALFLSMPLGARLDAMLGW